MSKLKRHEFSIGRSFVVAFVNSDESGMSDEDKKLIEEFIEQWGPELHVYAPEDQSPSFRKCDVSGLWDDCYICEVDSTK